MESNGLNNDVVKDANYYEELITQLNTEYEQLQENASNLSREELIEKEKDLDKRLKDARDSYNASLEMESYNNETEQMMDNVAKRM